MVLSKDQRKAIACWKSIGPIPITKSKYTSEGKFDHYEDKIKVGHRTIQNLKNSHFLYEGQVRHICSKNNDTDDDFHTFQIPLRMNN